MNKNLEAIKALVIGLTIGGIIALFSFGSLFAQESERVVLVDDALKPYVLNFSKVIVDSGWSLKKLTEGGNVFIIFDRTIDKDLEDAAGRALGMNDNNLVYVMINIEQWVDLTDFEKQDLINHELMHDIFNMEHTPIEDEDRLMHPSSYPDDWGDTMSRFMRGIKDVNEKYGA